MADNILEIRHLSKSFGTHEVLRDIDFTVSKGDVISIIGASGTAKTSPARASTPPNTALTSAWSSSPSTSSTT